MKRRVFSILRIFACVAIVSAAAAEAQEGDYYLGPTRYSFIKYDEDVLKFPAGEESFRDFFREMDQLVKTGDGKINIVHMGGSHIQADIYTHLLRKRFQELTPDMNGGRGLIFPFKMAKTNSPSNYSVAYNGNWNYCKSTQSTRECPLGLTGIAVSTSDSAIRITVNPNRDEDAEYRFNSVRIFHEPTLYQVGIRVKDSVYTGEYSVLGGFTRVSLPGYQKYLDLSVWRDSVPDQFVLQGISLDSDMPGVVYHAIGVNGSMLKSYLGSEHYVKHLRAVDPQLVLFSIGTNDAYTRHFDADGYRERFRRLIDSTLKASPDAAILLTVPNDSYLYRKYANKNTEKMEEIIFDLAKEYQCGVWDFYNIMGGLNSSQVWYSMDLMRYDRIHFNREGYLLKGELLFSAFLKAWENQPEYDEQYTTRETTDNLQSIQ